jgi:hypothetical protein
VARWPVLCDAAQLAPLAVAGAEPVADGGGAAVGLAGGDGEGVAVDDEADGGADRRVATARVKAAAVT